MIAADQALLRRLRSTEDDLDEIGERILDAALDQFGDFGLRRTTVDDVARRAGLARVTIYRRFATKAELLEAVIRREARRFLAELDTAVDAAAAIEDRVAEAFAVTLRHAGNHPVLTRLLRTEPETVLPSLTVRAGPLLAVGRAFLADHLRRAQHRGIVPPFDVDVVAEMLVRLVHSYLVTPQSCVALADDDQARAFARTYLAPLVTRTG